MGTIYVLRNKTNGKCYVGQTRRAVKKRLYEHIKYGKTEISRVLRKAGIDGFNVHVFCGVPIEMLDYAEAKLIEKSGTFWPGGYNHQTGGSVGLVRSAATRDRQSASMAGNHIGGKNPSARKVLCLETGTIYQTMKAAASGMGLKALSNICSCCIGTNRTAAGYHWQYYIGKMSESRRWNRIEEIETERIETHQAARKKMSESHSGDKAYWKGKRLSEETKQKISAARSGKKLSAAHKAAISMGGRGRVHSEETKRKMSESTKRWRRERRKGGG